MLQRLRRSIRRKRRATYCVTCEDSGHVACGINRSDYENVYSDGDGGGGGCDTPAVAAAVSLPNGRPDVRRSRGGDFPTVFHSFLRIKAKFLSLLQSRDSRIIKLLTNSCCCGNTNGKFCRRTRTNINNDSLGLCSSFGSANENEYLAEGNFWLDDQNRRLRAFYRQVAIIHHPPTHTFSELVAQFGRI